MTAKTESAVETAGSIFRRLADESRQSHIHDLEGALLAFCVDLNRRMEARGMTRKELAEAIGVKPAYVSRALRGDQNLTLKTMVRMARAVEGKLRVGVGDADRDGRWVEVANANQLTHVLTPAEVRRRAPAPVRAEQDDRYRFVEQKKAA